MKKVIPYIVACWCMFSTTTPLNPRFPAAILRRWSDIQFVLLLPTLGSHDNTCISIGRQSLQEEQHQASIGHHRLFDLIKQNDLDGIRTYLRDNPGAIEMTNDTLQTPLAQAAANGNYALCKLLLVDYQANPNGFCELTSIEHIKNFKALIARTFNETDETKLPPLLHYETKRCFNRRIEDLTEHDLQPWIVYPAPPLQEAIRNGHDDVAQLLRDLGATAGREERL